MVKRAMIICLHLMVDKLKYSIRVYSKKGIIDFSAIRSADENE